MDFVVHDFRLALEAKGEERAEPASPSRRDPAVTPGDGGHYECARMDNSGAPRVVTTMGAKSRHNWLATLVRGFPTFDNLLLLYRDYYDAPNNIDPPLAGSLDPPDEASQLGLEALRALNESLAGQVGQFLPFEEQWDDSQPLSRTSNDTTQRYTNSSRGYTPAESAFCSDTNHQGLIFCVDLLLFRFCAAAGPDTSTTSGFAPTR